MIYDKDGVLDLDAIAREHLGEVRRGLTTPRLYEEIVRSREGHLAHLGPVVVQTGHGAERSPSDVFVVPGGGPSRPWLAGPCREMSPEVFGRLLYRVLAYMQNKDVFVQYCVAAPASPRPLTLRVVTETAWASLLARNLLWPAAREGEAAPGAIDFSIVHAPRFQAVPEIDGTETSAFVVVNPAHRVLLVGGTSYGGELRQAVSTACRLLHADLDAMHLKAAVSVGPAGDVAAFLGRTGNGKTVLAADEGRRVVADHDCAWTADGIVSYGRGCYARVSDLTAEGSPAIWAGARRFGAVLENVSMASTTRRVDFGDRRLVENTRACFPLLDPHADPASGSRAGHPRSLFLLTRDTTGVLPPIARLTPDQAVFAFITSHAASLEETEGRPGDVRPVLDGEGLRAGPATVRPEAYAKAFLERIVAHGTRCWFVNTGWVGEPEGRGARLPLETTRTLVRAALRGDLDRVPTEKDPLFLFDVPLECPGVPAEVLDPRKSARDPGEYEVRAGRLAYDFIRGFERFEGEMPESVREMVDSVPIDPDSPDLLEQMMLSI